MNNLNRKFAFLTITGALLIAWAAHASSASTEMDAKQLEHMAANDLASRPWYAPGDGSSASTEIDAKQLEHMAANDLASRPWYAPADMPIASTPSDAEQMQNAAASDLASRPWYAPAGMPAAKPTVLAKANGATRTDASVVDGEQPSAISSSEDVRMWSTFAD